MTTRPFFAINLNIIRFTAFLGLLLAVFFVHDASAQAYGMHVVKSDYRKTSGGVGIWIANAPNGYVQGRSFPGDRIQVIDTVINCQDNDKSKCENWSYGIIKSSSFNGQKRKKPIYLFGWVKTADLQKVNSRKITNDSYIREKKNQIDARGSLGTDFNCDPHKCRGGKKLQLKCTRKPIFYNGVLTKKGKFVAFDRAGTAKKKQYFDYRYTVKYPTKKGNNYAMGRLHDYAGWVFIPEQCIPKGDRRYGGPSL